LRGRKGFTLVELILSVIILTVGIVSVQRVFINSLSALSVIEHWSQAERLLEGKIWELGREVLEKGKKFQKRQESGMLLGSDRTYQYNMILREIDPEAHLLEAKASISWGSFGAGHSIKRTFYLMVPYADWKG
jgi:prepilin-type N-terminal cleavage/methylation domain-containing protein